MTSLSVLRFIWTSHITCLSRIDFEVISRNLNSNPEIQVVQTGHVLKTQTTAQPSRPKWFMKPGSPWFPVPDVGVGWSKGIPGISGSSMAFPDSYLLRRKAGNEVQPLLNCPWDGGASLVPESSCGLFSLSGFELRESSCSQDGGCPDEGLPS